MNEAILRNEYASVIDRVSKKTGVPSDIMTKMLGAESSFNTQAVSPKGAKGIAQFMPDTAKQYGVNVDDPVSSIEGMGKYMKDLIKTFDGDRVKAVAAYNWGEGNVSKHGLEKAPKETRDYVKKVLGVDLDTYGSISVPNYFTPAQKQQNAISKAIQEEADENILERQGSTVDTGDIFSAGARLNFTHTSAIQKIKELLSDSDPNYVPPDPDEMERILLGRGLGMEYAPRLYEARSQEHFSAILNNIAEEQDARRTLGKTGLRGTIINLLTGVADPAGLLVGAATAGSGFLVAQGRAAYTAGQMGLGALGAGAIEAGLYGLQETKPAEEILEASITGALFQGGLGQFGYRPELQAALTRDLHKAAQEYRKASTEGLSTVGAQQADYVDDLMGERKVSPTLDELREDYIREGNVGAKYERLRFDASGWLLSRKQPTAQVLSRLGQDPIGINAENKAIGHSAEEVRNVLIHSTQTNWLREFNQAFKEFDKGGSWLGREARRKSFIYRIADLHESGIPLSQMTEEEAKAVKATREFFETYKKRLTSSGLVGPDAPIEKLNDGPYLPRIISSQKFRETADSLSRQSADLVDLFKNSLRSADIKDGTYSPKKADMGEDFNLKEHQELLEKLYDKIARGYVKNVLHYGNFRHSLEYGGMSYKDAGTLKALLKDVDTPAEEIDKILNTLNLRDTKPGTSRLKRRVDLDMTYSQEFTNKNGEKVTVRMADLFERDLDTLVPMYAHQMAGHIAVAETTGIKGRSDFLAALNKYKEEAVDVSDKEISKTISYSNYLYDAVTGVPLDSDPSSFLVTWGRRARDFNFAVRGGQFVWSQLTEAAPMLANIGLPALYKQMPELKNMVTLAADGKLNNELVRQLEAVTGIGASRLRQQIFTHFNPQDGVVVQGVDKALHKVGNFVSDVSGFNAVIAMEQRMMLAGMSQKLVDMAKKYKGSAKEILKNNSGEARNLRSLGLSDEQLESLFAHLADPSKVQFGKKGRVHVFKEDQWDPDVWNGFAMALHRLTTTVIQEGTYGGTMPFMHKAIGKLLFQFRSFAMNGIYKQTMRGVAIRDQVQWLTVAYGFTFGMLSYIAQTYDNYRGTDTYEARMSPQKIVEGAINRMGQASMLPAMVGWISGLYMGKEPLFNYARSSGLGSDIVQSIPSVHLLDDMYNGGLGSLNALLRDDYDFTKKEYRALLGLMPLASIPVLKHFFQYAGEDLPSKNVQDYGLHNR